VPSGNDHFSFPGKVFAWQKLFLLKFFEEKRQPESL